MKTDGKKVAGPRSGAVIGMGLLFYSAIFAYCLVAHRGFSVMGVSDQELTRIAMKNFLVPIIFYQLKMFLGYFLLGAAAGLFALLFTRLLGELCPIRGASPAGYLFSAALIVIIHLCFYFRAVALYPQLFIEYLYNQGGWGKSLQVWLTDRTGPLPFTIALSALAVFLLLLAALRLVRTRLYLQSRWRAGLGALLAVALVVSGAQAYDRLRPVTNHGPNLLVLAADSIRPDLLGFNGFPQNTSPAIDALARKGVSFDQAYAQLPRTFPSWLSFFTGEYPFQHGIQTMFPSVKARQKNFAGLPSMLKANGYATAVVSDFAGDIFTRIQLGFDTVRTPYFNFPTLIKMRSLEIHPPLLAYVCNGPGRRLLPELQDFASFADPQIQAHETIRLLKSYRQRDKFFMLVFFSTTHFPYAPPYPYYRMFTNRAYSGNYKYSKANLINVREEITAEDKAQMKGIFAGGIRATDDAIGTILAFLEKSGMARNTVVIFIADHGENMYELEYGMGHGEHLRGHYALRFPWVVSDPRRSFAVSRVSSPVRSIDFMPTALELLGIAPPREIAGQSLIPLLDGRTADMRLPVYAETGLWFVHEGPEFFQHLRLPYPDVTRICDFEKYYHNEIVLKDQYDQYTEVAKHRMLMDDGWKLIYMPLQSRVRWELYNLAEDPEERRNLAGTEPERLKLMKDKLNSLLLSRPGWTTDRDYFVPVTSQ